VTSDEEESHRRRRSDELRGGRVMAVRRFEDLIAWQKARAMTTHIYRITGI
jgi:hypothetical protein